MRASSAKSPPPLKHAWVIRKPIFKSPHSSAMVHLHFAQSPPILIIPERWFVVYFPVIDLIWLPVQQMSSDQHFAGYATIFASYFKNNKNIFQIALILVSYTEYIRALSRLDAREILEVPTKAWRYTSVKIEIIPLTITLHAKVNCRNV